MPAPRSVGETVAALIDPVLRQKSGMTLALLNAWPEIVGPRLERACRPERIAWPPPVAGGERNLAPATLIVACEGASALRLQHQGDEIVARVNTFFGYRAIGRLRIVQKPPPMPTRPDRRPRLRDLEPGETRAADAATARIADERLREALRAYAASILRRRQR